MTGAGSGTRFWRSFDALNSWILECLWLRSGQSRGPVHDGGWLASKVTKIALAGTANGTRF